MRTRIVCDICGETLRDGDIGEKTEHKTCISCVIAKAPSADMNKIKTLEPELKSQVAKEMEETNAAKRFKTINIEMPFKFIDGEWRIVIQMFDYYKKPFAELAFGKSKLNEFIEEIRKIEAEEIE